jgi:hypothetical protein
MCSVKYNCDLFLFSSELIPRLRLDTERDDSAVTQ